MRKAHLLFSCHTWKAGHLCSFPPDRFEAIVANQFHHTQLQCAQGSYVPYGPTYTDPAYGSCTLAGSQPGQQFVDGDAYIKAQFSYSYGHVWRNLGAVFGFLIL
jgi:ATP-binding cassette subfamily G (WHITE) protein 2 (SNQ2)